MLISIETHRTYDFPGGGHFIASANIKVLVEIIASVANWVLGSFFEADTKMLHLCIICMKIVQTLKY